MPNILCVDADGAAALRLEGALRQLGHEPLLTTRVHGAIEALKRRRFDLVLAAFRLPDGTGLDLLDAIGETADAAPVIVMTPHGRTDDALASLRRGALDVVTKPLRLESLRMAVQHGLENGRLQRENAAFRERITMLQRPRPIVGRSAELRRVLEMMDSVAPTRATVLLEGESGSGKELFAHAIHEMSPRRDRPMVTVPCAALSPLMAESAMFGEAPDPADPARARREGAFERADQGTLLLGEISEMSLDLQARLLRTIQHQEFEPTPGARPIRVDVRLIATTRHDLREQVAIGRFRRDLYFRMSVVMIRAPALRERLEDLPCLVEHFAQRAAEELGIRTPAIPEETLDRLRRHAWPGNVHELANAVERAVILCRDAPLLPAAFDLRGASEARGDAGAGEAVPVEPSAELFDLRTLKHAALHRALEATGGHRGQAARMLGISERTLRNMLNRGPERPRRESARSEERESGGRSAGR